MNVVVTRMQDLVYAIGFQNFPGVIPRTSTAGGTTPSSTHLQPCLWPGAWCKRPGVGTQTLAPSTFQPWLRPWFGHITLQYWDTIFNV